MKTYCLEPTLTTRLQWIAPALMIVLFPSLVLLAQSARNPPPPFLAVLPVMGGVLVLIWTLRMPTRIEVGEDGSMDWVAPLRRVRLAPSDILSIAPHGSGHGRFVLTHASGRLEFVNQFTGFHELLTQLEKANPAVELRGC